MVDTDRTILRVRKESSYGAGAAGAKLAELPHSSHSLRFKQTRSESDDIDSNRDVASHTLSDQEADGSISAEYRRAWNDDILEGAMQSDWAATVTVIAANTGVSYVHSTKTFSIATAWTNQPAVGSWILVAGFAGAKAVLNGVYEVTSRDANDIVVAKGTGTAAGDHTAGDSVSITQLGRLTNGTTDESYVFEEELPQIASEFEEFVGYAVNTLGISTDRSGGNGKVNLELGLVGGASTKESATSGDGSPTAKTTNRPYSGPGGEGGFWLFENDTLLLAAQTGFSIANGREAMKVLGQLVPIGMGSGKFRVTVNWRAYHTSVQQAWETAARAGTLRDYAVVFKDAAGNYDIFHVPSVAYETAEKPNPGKEQRRMISAQGMGERDSTLGFTAQWARHNIA
jgi:hypothetical protein